MRNVNRQWLLKRRPQGALSLEDFEYREVEMPDGDLKEGEVLVHNVAFLCAPTMLRSSAGDGQSMARNIAHYVTLFLPNRARVHQRRQ